MTVSFACKINSKGQNTGKTEGQCYVSSPWLPMALTDVSSQGSEGRCRVTLYHVIITRDSHRRAECFLETERGQWWLRNEQDEQYKDVRLERRKRRKTHSLDGGHGFRKFATQVDRKIRDEWRSDTMQARCRREQNRRHPPSGSVAATRISPEIRPTGTIHHRFAKEERTRRNIKKGGKSGRAGGRQKGRSRF